MYAIDQVMSIANSHQLLIVSLAFVTYLFGFCQYITSMVMQMRNKQGPFSFWMHCWYFGHDLTFVLLFKQWFYDVDFWLFKVLWAGCVAFVLIELYSLFLAVKYERHEVWGKYYDSGKISENKAWIRGFAGYATGFLLFQIIRLGIGDPMCLVLMMSTNAILAIALQFRAEEIKERQPGAIPLAIFTLLGTVFTFSPPGIGFFATAVSALNHSWFYTLGVFCTVCAIRYLVLAIKFNKKAGFSVR